MKEKFKKNIFGALIFILGVIVTLGITLFWNMIFPEKPVIIKEVSDSIKIVHEYKMPLTNDSTELILEKKLKNIKLLNDYEQEIEKRQNRILAKDVNTITPNLISINNQKKYEYKGYTQGNSSSYFTLNIPDLNNSKFIDFKLDFFNPEILKSIAFFRLEIFKFQNITDKESRIYVLNEFYEPRQENNNFIRLENNLLKGKYEFQIGFTLKSDTTSKYPTFYMKKFIIVKE